MQSEKSRKVLLSSEHFMRVFWKFENDDNSLFVALILHITYNT